MKQKLQRNIETKLADAARAVLARYKPTIVAVTGSVGKTSTKDAIAMVLGAHGSVRASEGNYNNELGVPLTILGERSPGRSMLGWWSLMRRARKLAVGSAQSEYPEVLVLEMAMDHPGDLAKLVAIAKPNISVVTNVGESHLEFFPDVAAIAKEKATIVEALGPEGVAIVNADNEWTAKMGERARKRITVGIESQADVQGIEVAPTDQLPDAALKDQTVIALRGLGVPLGTAFKISYQGQTVPVRLPRVLGNQQVYSALAAAAVGLARGLNLVDISEALLGYMPAPGRMSLIPGVKNSLIIDDTYNASPASTIAALDVLAQLKPSGRRIAVLGDMAELGTATESGHQAVGTRAATACDFAVFVGPKSKWAAQAAERQGLVDQRQTHVLDSRQVEAVLQSVMRQGDVLLVKGSQVMRMERVVKALMAEPLEAPHLLVRQSEGWDA